MTSQRPVGDPNTTRSAPELASIVLMTLGAPNVTFKSSDLEHPWVDLATAFQSLGSFNSWADIHGVLHGQEFGRVAEVLGLAAAAGEQLGLAYTCHLDTARWLARPPTDIADSSKEDVSARVFAEMGNYYALGAGHALYNASARLLSMEKMCAATLKLSPFDDRRNAWPSFNQPSIKSLEKAISGKGLPNTLGIVKALRSLLDDTRWCALVDRRAIGYHRWRPQSVAGGAATTNPWQLNSSGQYINTLSANSQHRPLNVQDLADEAKAGLDALGESMQTWNHLLPKALRELGVPLFKVDEESE